MIHISLAHTGQCVAAALTKNNFVIDQSIQKAGLSGIVNRSKLRTVVPNDHSQSVFTFAAKLCYIHFIVNLIVRKIRILSPCRKLAVNIGCIIAISRNLQNSLSGLIEKTINKFSIFIILGGIVTPDPLRFR